MKSSIFTVLMLLFLVIVVVPSTHALPAQFEDTLVAEISAPTDLAWTPDGRILVTTKGGQLRVVENGVLVSTPAIDLASVMCTNGERALGGVAVHPNYAANNYIYLYYTFNKNGTCNESEIDGPVNRLSRFILPPSNVIDPASEFVLFDTPPLFRDHHNGGDIEFAVDGLLYVTVGDGGSQRFDWPQDPGQLFGKIVRLTDTGEIPADNPYTGADSARCNVDGVPPAGSPVGTKCQEVYSLGLRNPFRFSFDPNASGVRYFINDVGQHTWEEISEGPVAGGNYGWPQREGPCVLDSTTDCVPPSGLIDPVHWYQHGPNGAAATGGAFVPNGIWPTAFDGSYMFADYVFGTIYQLSLGGAGCRLCVPPTSNGIVTEFTTAESVVAMAFGPHGNTQALYYVTRGFGPSSIDGLRRIAFTGTANRAPTAVATANPTAGLPPLNVQFDGSASSDPDGDTLTYEWDFEGDGVTDSTAVSPAHTYSATGAFFATLTVRDGNGGDNTTSIRIDVGNTLPLPVIEAPIDGTAFYVGQVFTLQGSATDAEDGVLPDTALTWEVRQHHATHFHPFLDPTTGNNIVTPGAPEPEDLVASTNSYLEILLTATDSAGLSATVSRIVLPRKVDLTFESVPSGLNLTLDGSTITTPATVVSWEAHQLQVNAPNQTSATGVSYEWASWSDGGAQAHAIVVPPSPSTYSATFNQVASTTLTFTPMDDATVRSDSPTENLGASPLLEVDGSPEKVTLLKFNVSGVGSTSIANAILRLYTLDGSPSGGDFFAAASSTWSESTVTWATAPAAVGGLVASLGNVDLGNWYEIDVTSLVTGDGTISLRISSSNLNGADYSSKENPNGFAPQLVVTLNAAPDTTPPIITLLGDNPLGLTVGDTFTDPGATATDDVDGDITANVVVTGTVDTNTVGSNTLTYNVSDAAGNAATPVTRTVNVVAATASVDVTFTIAGGHTTHTLPLEVTLVDPATSAIILQQNLTSTGDASSGHFSLSGVTPGSYDLYVKGSSTLRAMQSVTLVAGSNAVTFAALRSGDANGDNVVSLADFSILALSFNKVDGTPGYDGRADFNGDNVVSLADFSKLALNFNTVGVALPVP